MPWREIRRKYIFYGTLLVVLFIRVIGSIFKDDTVAKVVLPFAPHSLHVPSHFIGVSTGAFLNVRD